MSDNENIDFAGGDAGASHTYPMQAGSVRKQGHVMLKDHPCKVVDFSTSKTGKHGHAKAHIIGLDIFTGKKFEDICPTSHNIDVPIVKRTEMQLIDITSDGFCSLLYENGDTKDDLIMPRDNEGNLDDVGKQIQSMFEEGKSILVTVIAACGQEKIISVKELA
uniref:Eukaryotic translation initiation factor 5A n=1 Tax=Nephromyces sp. MMRI TaxID=2496275 RepID=A0A3Q8UBN7_9APIC|nr:putative N-acetyl-beta glucosaminidase [Nephromyces sp. MMRI]AZL94374.1 putative N-acetyl-beta glucosaminidase [Nephromyces sp. MMRI]